MLSMSIDKANYNKIVLESPKKNFFLKLPDFLQQVKASAFWEVVPLVVEIHGVGYGVTV